jgi:hypothetical protein
VKGSVINIATARAKTTDGEYELLAAGTTLR